ncbi:hypothetical protein [Streptomyces sp. N50]|uniref:hypothetical protein n=1 Tax=Streptomyces sp. N50 TaxID=3081765 RepID=UPI0029625631|nr:hypothetical protein [Streptomyces sp. N50]WOX12334.1 hypothetical protein R2B38_27405 [Streptomyces sp. N50]
MMWTALGALACALLAVPGAIALTTGWLPPKLRVAVVRPKLWGYGGLLSAVGLTTEMSLSVLAPAEQLIDFFGPLGFALLLLGFLLQSRARRPAAL